ncbi:MAG: oxidoreductase [Bacteroidota bacterium]|nr:oxidoreductase [Bacteroidota bacterium]
MKKYLFIIFGLLSANTAFSQKIKVLTSAEKTSIRGLCVVTDKIIWVSGSNGLIGRSIDGGETWKWMPVKGFEKTDFRDIEAFDATTAVIMGIAAPAYILKTVDAGETWKMVYENKTKGMFLDAMEFWNEQSGIVIGDPIDNKFFIARTFDGGNTWRDIPKQYYPAADSGEACFASSGTNIRALAKDEACFVSGGLRSRLFIRDKKIDLPILQGTQTTGANSLAVKNKKTLIVTGGDFTKPDFTEKNCFITNNGGKTWTAPAIAPHGYRSCIEYIGKTNWICCGLNGVDYSTDDGKTWHLISDESFHVCRKAKNGKSVFLAGINGKIGKLILK